MSLIYDIDDLHYYRNANKIFFIVGKLVGHRPTLRNAPADPYCFPVEEWEIDHCDVPAIDFSDVALYMVTTPSPYTKETVEDDQYLKYLIVAVYVNLFFNLSQAWKGMLDASAFVSAAWVGT